MCSFLQNKKNTRRFVAHALCQFEHARCQANHSRNLANLFFVPLEQVPYVPSHSPCGMFTTGCRVVVLLVLQRLVRSVGHLVTAPVNLFAVCSCLLTSDSTSTLHEALASLCLSQWLLCLRPYHRLGRSLSHPPRKCVRWTPNPWS